MYSNSYKYCLILLVLLSALRCRKPYVPAVFVKGDSYLVVDGFINTSPAGITTINLSRTKSLTDTVVNIPESGAQIIIQNASGISYSLTEQATSGIYNSNPLQLNNTDRFKILITTNIGKHYTSDLVAAKQTPAIDSINWTQDTVGVHVFVNTHDPLNKTRYYRWQYIQTWEYDSQLSSPWGLHGNVIYVRDPVTEQVDVCYKTTPSSSIMLNTSIALAQDIISMAPLYVIPANDSTLTHRMSIQVLQFALTPEAYFYWQIIQKNSQQLGTLFDLQPSQLEGNIHSLDNSTEPVVGFLSAGIMVQKRIFISKDDLTNWHPPGGSYPCVVKVIDTDPVDFSKWTYPDDSFVPWYFSGSSLLIAKKECIDCTLSGGTTTKPSFW